MKYRATDTLAGILGVQQTQMLSLAHCMVPTIVGRTADWRKTCGHVSPEKQAARFYALNQIVAAISQKFAAHEPLPDWAANLASRYCTELADQSVRLFHYTLCVITRESRHIGGVKADWWPKMDKKYGEEFQLFNVRIRGKGSDQAVEKLISSPPNMEVGAYGDGLAVLFNTGKFSSAYGGKPWGLIAQTLADFVNGRTSVEMMVDTAYTLAHNNGPMFNKGIAYEMYTSAIYRVLDLQRGGQVVEAVLSSDLGFAADVALRQDCATAKQNMPEAFGEYVNWFQVEELGSVKKYPQEKTKQEANYGAPQVKPVPKKVDENGMYETNEKLEIFPQVFVQKLSRAA